MEIQKITAIGIFCVCYVSAQQAKQIYRKENIKKLYSTNAARWHNKACNHKQTADITHTHTQNMPIAVIQYLLMMSR
jgi:hypothetical protein